MASSLIHGKYVICKVISRTEAEVIETARCSNAMARSSLSAHISSWRRSTSLMRFWLGWPRRHARPRQQPSSRGPHPVSARVARLSLGALVRQPHGGADVPPYLDTLYSAFEMLESGITTVQHLHGWRGGAVARVRAVAEQILKAYRGHRHAGVRTPMRCGTRTGSSTRPTRRSCKRLPAHLARQIAAYLQPRPFPWLITALLRGPLGAPE